MISFTAEITKAEVKKTLSLDREYKITIITSDSEAIKLQDFIGTDQVVKVSVEVE